MPLGPITNLPAMPSPTAGQIPYNGQAEQLGMAAAIKQAMDRKKAEAQQRAKDQLPMLIQMAKAQPGNAQVQNSLAQALKTMGLPVPMTQQQPTGQGDIQPQGGVQGGPPIGPPAPAGPATGGNVFQTNTPSPGAGPTGGAGVGAASPSQVSQPNLTMINPGQPNLNTGQPLPNVQSGDAQSGIAQAMPNATPQQQGGGIANFLKRFTGGGQQQPFQGQVDVSALQPSAPITDQDAKFYLSLDPKVRASVAAARQQVLPNEMLSMSKVYSPDSPEYKELHASWDKLNLQAALTQGMTPQKWEGMVGSMRGEYKAAGIDPDSASPDVMSQVSATTQAKIDHYESLGIHLQNADKYAAINATTMADYRQAMAKLAGVRAANIPVEEQRKQAADANRITIARQKLTSQVDHWNQMYQQAVSNPRSSMAVMNMLRGSMNSADSTMKYYQTQLNTARARVNWLTTTGGIDPTDTDNPTLADALRTVEDMQNKLATASDISNNVTNYFASKAGLTSLYRNNGGSTTGSLQSTDPQQTPAALPAGAPKPVPPGTPPKAMLNGKPIFLQDNHYVYQDGSPAQ